MPGDEQLRRLDDLGRLIGAVAEACYRYAHRRDKDGPGVIPGAVVR